MKNLVKNAALMAAVMVASSLTTSCSEETMYTRSADGGLVEVEGYFTYNPQTQLNGSSASSWLEETLKVQNNNEDATASLSVSLDKDTIWVDELFSPEFNLGTTNTLHAEDGKGSYSRVDNLTDGQIATLSWSHTTTAPNATYALYNAPEMRGVEVANTENPQVLKVTLRYAAQVLLRNYTSVSGQTVEIPVSYYLATTAASNDSIISYTAQMDWSETWDDNGSGCAGKNGRFVVTRTISYFDGREDVVVTFKSLVTQLGFFNEQPQESAIQLWDGVTSFGGPYEIKKVMVDNARHETKDLNNGFVMDYTVQGIEFQTNLGNYTHRFINDVNVAVHVEFTDPETGWNYSWDFTGDQNVSNTSGWEFINSLAGTHFNYLGTEHSDKLYQGTWRSVVTNTFTGVGKGIGAEVATETVGTTYVRLDLFK